MFTLALLQMEVVGGDKERNLRRAEALLAEAAGRGAQFALLPEAMDLGWTDPSCLREAEPIPAGGPCCRLAAAARAHRLYVCAGLTERDEERVYNAAVIIDPSGRVILKHRKLNELEIGHPYYAQGDRLNVCHTPLGTLGLLICADGFARDRVPAQALGYMGADLILSPSSWAVDANHDNRSDPYGALWRASYTSVARDFAVWIAGVSNVGWITGGPWQGKQCIGCSLVVGPGGKEVLQGPYGVTAETILYVDVALHERPARGCGWMTYWSAQAANASSTPGDGRHGHER
jgi:predicted amidohydrolase